jgi:hypothetical protein
MSARGGGLTPLSIGAVFVVVLALMYGGVQFSKGELLPADTTDETEDALRDAVWTELDERRAARGLDPMPRDRFMRGIAQDTTDTLAAERAETAGWTDGSSPPLVNTRLFCTQVPVRVEVDGSEHDPSALVADALVAADDNGVAFRAPDRFRAGMGIAVHEGTVYAVYRSCEQVDT